MTHPDPAVIFKLLVPTVDMLTRIEDDAQFLAAWALERMDDRFEMQTQAAEAMGYARKDFMPMVDQPTSVSEFKDRMRRYLDLVPLSALAEIEAIRRQVVEADEKLNGTASIGGAWAPATPPDGVKHYDAELKATPEVVSYGPAEVNEAFGFKGHAWAKTIGEARQRRHQLQCHATMRAAVKPTRGPAFYDATTLPEATLVGFEVVELQCRHLTDKHPPDFHEVFSPNDDGKLYRWPVTAMVAP